MNDNESIGLTSYRQADMFYDITELVDSVKDEMLLKLL